MICCLRGKVIRIPNSRRKIVSRLVSSDVQTTCSRLYERRLSCFDLSPVKKMYAANRFRISLGLYILLGYTNNYCAYAFSNEKQFFTAFLGFPADSNALSHSGTEHIGSFPVKSIPLVMNTTIQPSSEKVN